MLISSTYICPVRGLMGLDPAEPTRLGQVAKIAGNLGLEQLQVPVLEESLLGTKRQKVQFLDGLVQGLEEVENTWLTVCLMATAQRILGMDWVPPYLAKGSVDPGADKIFLDGKLRNLRPYQWWSDASIIQKRIELFRELVSAVSGHSALSGWIIMDRAFEWPRPDLQAADFILKSFCAEIRDRHENGDIYLSIGLSELLAPEMVRSVTGNINGLHIRGIESNFVGLEKPDELATEISLSAYICTLAQWLFNAQIGVEIGWSMPAHMRNQEEILNSILLLVGQGVATVNWLSLIDPERKISSQPPWGLSPGLERVGLLDQDGEPKEGTEIFIQGFHPSEVRPKRNAFLDIGLDEYLAQPHLHFQRLWKHFMFQS